MAFALGKHSYGVCDRCGGIEIEDPLIQHVGVIY